MGSNPWHFDWKEFCHPKGWSVTECKLAQFSPLPFFMAVVQMSEKQASQLCTVPRVSPLGLHWAWLHATHQVWICAVQKRRPELKGSEQVGEGQHLLLSSGEAPHFPSRLLRLWPGTCFSKSDMRSCCHRAVQLAWCSEVGRQCFGFGVEKHKLL